MTDRSIIEWLGSLGGTVRERPMKPPRKRIWAWRLAAHNDVIAFLEALLPYLRVKRAEAEEALRQIRQPDDDKVMIEAAWKILTVHHLDSDKSNCRWWNLVALDQRCHLRMQRAVIMDRPWHYEHSEWFRPYAAGFYAWKYLNEDLTREETMARLDELLALERRWTQEKLTV